MSSIKGRVLDTESNEAIPFANVVLYNNNEIVATATTNIDGEYAIKPIPSGTYTIKVSYIGYTPGEVYYVSLFPDKMTNQDIKIEANKLLQSVEVVAYEAPLVDPDYKSGKTVTREGYQYSASKTINSVMATTAGVYLDESVVETNYISNSLKTVVVNMEYTIDIPYTIPSDGEDYGIKIKDVSLPVNYVYHAIPKLESDVFLTAEIKDWTQLNLVSGKSSIYYQGTFTGESFIDANHSGDTLTISLGRDKNVIVAREGNKQMIDKRIVGSSIKETIGWDITVKNNKDAKIKITIHDQFPVSEKKSIEVERLESSGAKVEEKTGKLTWELQLEPNEKKTLSYKYSVKYPKNVSLAIE